MASEPHQDVLAEAVEWHLRLREGADGDWDEFVLWLEGDPARSEAYDRIEASHFAMSGEAFTAQLRRPHPVAANDEAAGGAWWRGRWAIGLAAVAAAILVAFLALPSFMSRPDFYEVATGAGQRREIAIGDGSAAVLNGSTRLILDRNDPRYAELASGEATFTVRHDSRRPFTVVAGDHRVQDVGTSFNLIRDHGNFSVEVIEGAVIYNPASAAVPLSAGQTLLASGGARPVVGRTDPGAIAGWRRGQLSYAGASMERVAGDVSRTLGVSVAVDPGLARQPFTGSIRIQGDSAATVADLAASVGLQARRSGRGWVIGSQPRAPR
jgi:transmembrane sensor